MITSDAVSVAAENAVVPPLTDTSTRLPLLPLARSQARKVMALAIVPLKLALGWKYRRVLASAASRRAEVLLTAPSAFQLVPPLVE